MLKQFLTISLFLIFSFGCSEQGQVSLEFRIAEDEPASDLTEMVFEMTGEKFYLHNEVLVDQTDIDTAFVTKQNDRPAVLLILTPEGKNKFEKLTENNIGKRCAMILDGELVSAPRIMATISEGRALLSGNFTEAEAREIAGKL